MDISEWDKDWFQREKSLQDSKEDIHRLEQQWLSSTEKSSMTKNSLETSLPQDELWHRIYQGLKVMGVSSVTLEKNKQDIGWYAKYQIQEFAEYLAKEIEMNERSGD